MLDIADALGDAEAYWAEYRDHDPEALTVPAIAAEVAQRLTPAGRAAEALALLQGADPTLARRRAGAEEWCDARLAALEALGRHDEAQAQRWEYALMDLSRRHLREYLKKLPAFEDATAEERALNLVAEHDDLQEALWFLLHWPEPRRAAGGAAGKGSPLGGHVLPAGDDRFQPAGGAQQALSLCRSPFPHLPHPGPPDRELGRPRRSPLLWGPATPGPWP
jgi:hypothetical protein